MSRNNPLLRSALTVFGFWWLLFTLREFGWSPVELVRNWEYIAYQARLWAIGAVAGAGAGAWWIWFKRADAQDKLAPTEVNGIICSLGRLPGVPPPPKIKSDRLRLPITSPAVLAWIKEAQAEYPEHVEFFFEIWDTYSAHADWPASHRVGGHGGRRLWEHCLAVVETCLQNNPPFEYKGVILKSKGKRPQTIIEVLDPDFEFNPNDPLIPVLALAHDIGKLEAYKRNEDGTFGSPHATTGQDFDDLGVNHDSLGARILARMPGNWSLPYEDCRILNFVISHYHHPADFPVKDRAGTSLGDRMCSLLQFLIEADRATGKMESGLIDEEDVRTLGEEDTAVVYGAAVEIMTEPGRIQAYGEEIRERSEFSIGEKHGQLIVIREAPFRALLLAKLNLSMEEGTERQRVTRFLLEILKDKGLLYTEHGGADFTPYSPLWNVDFYRAGTDMHSKKWKGCIVIKLPAVARELGALSALRSKKSRMKVLSPSFSHSLAIHEPEHLRILLEQAFGKQVADGIRIPASDRDVLHIQEQGDRNGLAFAPAPVDETPIIQPEASPVERASGSAIREEDAPNCPDLTQDPKAKQAVPKLEAASRQEGPTQRAQGKKPRMEVPTLETLQLILERHPEAISGDDDGHFWVFQPHLAKIAGNEAFLHAQTVLNLPVRDIGGGNRYLGIPHRASTQARGCP